MNRTAPSCDNTFRDLTGWELDELITRLTAAWRALALCHPMYCPLRADTREVLADAHRAWLAAYDRGGASEWPPWARDLHGAVTKSA